MPSWCIGAGAIRNLVWDRLHDFAAETPPADIDLVYFDGEDISEDAERRLEAKLAFAEPGFRWDVVNQAGVHQWVSSHALCTGQPFRSLSEGIASWPEFATCVGVTLTNSAEIEIVAPHGLCDLFGMIVRWNPTRVGRAVFAERVASKRFAERWPKVTVMTPP
ncbi:MAG: nucleotidyltransferase family protein [Moraxellaceae bacterium]|nr:nucleotidyltransferase family protein [Moraxellaceae bacterium]